MVERIWRMVSSRPPTAASIRSATSGGARREGALQGQPGGEEALDDRALCWAASSTPSAPVAGIDQAHRSLDDTAERGGQRQVRADRQHRIDQMAKPVRVVDLAERHQSWFRRRSARRAA